MPSPSSPHPKTHIVPHNSSIGWLAPHKCFGFFWVFSLYFDHQICVRRNTAGTQRAMPEVLWGLRLYCRTRNVQAWKQVFPVVPLCFLLWYCHWVVLEVYIPCHIKHCCIVWSQIPLRCLMALRSPVLLYFSVHQPCFWSSCSLSELVLYQQCISKHSNCWEKSMSTRRYKLLQWELMELLAHWLKMDYVDCRAREQRIAQSIFV